jgi:Raf kinase inhibitor-like YbhB/YbcL family protein
MLNLGSHHYDIKGTPLRHESDSHGMRDEHADRAANEELERDRPSRPIRDPEWAAGPYGKRGTSRGDPDIDDPPRPLADDLELRSGAFNHHMPIPHRYSYDGGNVSPPLEWGGIPNGAKELVLLCEDPDAPSGTFTHWVVTNISPSTTGVAEGALPEGGTPGRNDFGRLGWAGPRPPVGDEPHRYFFRLYAADKPLGLDEAATAKKVHAALDDHTLARGTLVGLFGR